MVGLSATSCASSDIESIRPTSTQNMTTSTTIAKTSIEAPGASKAEKVYVTNVLLADGGTQLLTINDTDGNIREIVIEDAERFGLIEANGTYIISYDESGQIFKVQTLKSSDRNCVETPDLTC